MNGLIDCLMNGMDRQESVLKAFTAKVEGIVNFEVTMDALNKTQNRGFGFATFDTVASCKAAHGKYFKDKLKIMVSENEADKGGREGY